MTDKNIKNIMKYIGALLLFILAGSLFTAKPCLAASAEIELSTNSTEITAGDRIFVYVKVNSDIKSGGFEANVTYNEDVLEYQSKASFVSGNNGYLRISDTEGEASNSRKYTLEFEATQVGVCEIAIDGRAMVYDYDTGDDMPVSSNVLKINVKAPATASEDAYLQSLKINPSVLTPAFDKNVFDYSTSVGSDVNNLIIDALPEDKKATVSISGNESLKEGENKIVITVLAESGAVIEYTINVAKEAAPAEVPDNTSADPTLAANTLGLIQKDGVIYAVYQGKYKLAEPGSDVTIPAGYVKTKIIISDISISAYYPENNMDSEFLLIYAVNDQGESGFYRYDKIEKTLQRFDSGETAAYDNSDGQTSEETAAQADEYRSNLNKAALIIALLSILCIILIILMVRFILQSKGNKKRRR
jgi:hypothetical protein